MRIVQLSGDDGNVQQVEDFFFMILTKKKKFDDPNMTIARRRIKQVTNISSSSPSALSDTRTSYHFAKHTNFL